MRTILLAVVIVTLGGCAGTREGQRSADAGGGSSPDIPVVNEQPSLAERRQYSRQQEANQVRMARTEVRGNLK